MGTSSRIPAAERTVQILRYLGSRVQPTAAGTIARDLGLPRSSTYHLLSVLEREGVVVHLADEGRYAPSSELLGLGTAFARRGWLGRLGRPILDRLVRDVGFTGHLAVLDDRDVVYLLERRPPSGDLLITDEHVRLPAYLTASGRALLASVAPTHLRALYPSRGHLVLRTDRGPTSLRDLRRELEVTADRGWASEDGEVTPGFASVAAAASNHDGHTLAAIAVTFRQREAGDPLPPDVVEAVREAAAELTARCGGASSLASGTTTASTTGTPSRHGGPGRCSH